MGVFCVCACVRVGPYETCMTAASPLTGLSLSVSESPKQKIYYGELKHTTQCLVAGFLPHPQLLNKAR